MTRLTRRRLITWGAMATACGPTIAQVGSTSYPTRTVKIVVPFAAGGGGDTLARLVAEKLAGKLHQAVIVENKPGASAMIASESVAKAEPDGHTILLTVPLLVQAPALYQRVPYRLEDFSPVIDLVTSPLWLAVSTAKTSATTVPALAEELRAQPGKHGYGSIGQGSTSHLLAESLNQAMRLDLVHAPYRGGAPVNMALIGGEITLAFLDYGLLKPALQSGKVRLVAVTGTKRSQLTPQIPTFQEAGLSGFDFQTWAGLLVPTKTPAAVTQRLHDEVAAILQQPDVTAKLLDLGFVPAGQESKAFQKQLQVEQGRWASLIRSAGLKPE